MQLKYEYKYNKEKDGFPMDQLAGVLIYDGKLMDKAACGGIGQQEITPDQCEMPGEIHNENKLQAEAIRQEQDENTIYEYDEECLKKKKEMAEHTQSGDARTQSCSCNINEEENRRISHTESWQEKIFHVFPKCVISINGRSTNGVKLKPHDMVWFPGKYWRLASNKFLLNGYYNYRYIIFFKGTGEYEGKYYLGTPGNFCVNSAITAKQFGFTDFFQAEGSNEGENLFKERGECNFGFWCREA